MVPPPATPHRFITPKPPTKSKQTDSHRYHGTQTPSTQQFAATPRFTFGSTPRTKTEANTPATQFSSPLLRRPNLPKPQREDIEEAASSQEPDPLPETALPIRSPASKRRRPNPPPATDAILISSSSPSASPGSTPPTTPPHHTTGTSNPTKPTLQASLSTPHPPRPPQFRLHPYPQPTHPTLSTPSTATHSHTIPSRPPLLLPPRSPSPPPTTQSAFFSPSRRGQRFVPGGMAEKVRGWILEASQHAQVTRKGEWNYEVEVGEGRMLGRGNGVGKEVTLARDVEGGGWLFVGMEGRMGRGRGGDVRGDGGGRDVAVGCRVGVKEPSWEVELDGEMVRVAVEWTVIEQRENG